MKGHNCAEPALQGCAVLTGKYVGHFSAMIRDLQQLAPSSIQQVGGEEEIVSVLSELLSDAAVLRRRGEAASYAAAKLAQGVVNRVWEEIDAVLLQRALGASGVLEEDKG